MKKKLLFVILLVLFLIRPLIVVYKNFGIYVSRDYMEEKYTSYENAYANSQYVNKKARGFMPDETLEAFAGGAFLKGLNPIMIVHDQPPLGRYITALSILVFDNEKTIPVILYLISILILYLISLEVTEEKTLALVPVGIFINEPLFLNKFNYMPLLEPIQFPFILLGIYLFILAADRKKYLPLYVILAVILGFVIGIRYFVLGAVLVFSFLIYFLIRKEKGRFLAFLISLPASLLILLFSYYRTFRSGYSLIQVLGIQKYIFFYHKSAFVQPFTFWDLFLFNRWHTWWEPYEIISDPQWSILWPLSVVLLILGLSAYFRKKISLTSNQLILLLWISCYCVMLSVGYSSTRYFLPLVPLLYILVTSLSGRILNRKLKG